MPAPAVAVAGQGGQDQGEQRRPQHRTRDTSVDRSDATRRPSAAMPGVMPNAATATAVSTNHTAITSQEKFGDASASGPEKIPAMR